MVVVVVNKDESTIFTSHAPSVIDKATKLTVIADTPSKFHAVTEFGYQTFSIYKFGNVKSLFQVRLQIPKIIPIS